MSEQEPQFDMPFYLQEFGKVLPQYRNVVVNRIKDKIAEVDLPAGSDIAADLLLGTYFQKTPDGFVPGPPIDPEVVSHLAGIDLPLKSIRKVASKLGNLVSSSVRTHEVLTTKPAQYIRETMSPEDKVDGFGMYLKRASANPLLKAEEEVELGFVIESGRKAAEALQYSHDTTDQERATAEEAIDAAHVARGRFVCANTRLVVSIAKKYQNQGLLLDDLVQEGNITVIKAVEKWNPGYGIKLGTLASGMIKSDLVRALHNDSRTIRLPAQISDKLRSIKYHNDKIAAERGGVEPSREEMAELFSMSPDAFDKLQAYEVEMVSYDALCENELVATYDDKEDEYYDLACGPAGETRPEFIYAAEEEFDDSVFAQVERGAVVPELVAQTLSCLFDREANIIRMHFGLNETQEVMTLNEVGKEIGVTAERIRKLEIGTMSKLRHPSRSGKLQGLLEVGLPFDPAEDAEAQARSERQRYLSHGLPRQDIQGNFVWPIPDTSYTQTKQWFDNGTSYDQ